MNRQELIADFNPKFEINDIFMLKVNRFHSGIHRIKSITFNCIHTLKEDGVSYTEIITYQLENIRTLKLHTVSQDNLLDDYILTLLPSPR